MGCEWGVKMKKKSYELAKIERYRTSIFTDDLKVCYLCGLKGIVRAASDKHEILYGSNRKNSMLFGYVLPLCRTCHDSMHKNHVLTKLWCKKCQVYHEKKYGVQDWFDKFHRNYI